MFSDSHRAQALHDARSEFPTTVRQAVHDLTQPLQALRMMLGLPGVIVDDDRGLSRKVDSALDDLDVQLNLLHALARMMDGGGAPTTDPKSFAQILDAARQLAPDLWNVAPPQRRAELRIRGRNSTQHLPGQGTAWVINALLEQAWHALPGSRIVVGVRGAGEQDRGWVIVADDGAGMAESVAQQLELTLNGEAPATNKTPLGSGLLLARLLVASWAGRWRVISKPGKGSVFAFSVPENCQD